MFKDVKVRWFFIFVVMLASAYKIWPTYKYYTLSDSDNYSKSDLKQLRDEAISLGLDLQGGMYVLLEVDIPILMKKLATRRLDTLETIIDLAKNKSDDLQSNFFDEFENLVIQKKIRLVRYYSDISSSRENDSILDALKSKRDDAINSALGIIRNRVDEFGVAEPNIQKYGKNRIIVELAGVQDADRARSLIQRTASLEFTLVMNEKLQSTIDLIDDVLLKDGFKPNFNITNNDQEKIEDTTKSSIDELFENTENKFDSKVELFTDAEILKDAPFSGFLKSFPGGIGVMENEYLRVKEILNREDVLKAIPRDGKFLWGNRTERAALDESGAFVDYRLLFYVRTNPEISGGMVKDPQATIASAGSDVSGQWVVNLAMTSQGARKWSRFTGANINKQVAIVLDEKVFMAPVIRDKIPGGRTQISGFADVNEAKDIANVLHAGELPAPVNIIEERTVGPSLGSDSVVYGKRAIMVGLLFVIIFMFVYYKLSGGLANIALGLNLVIVMAVLASIGATLTLPGIAGLILTIGMAVDANVIVFERIKEELDIGKTVRAAISSGYEKAFITILDANITTLIAAFVLAWIGSGPIKGFAITLSTGIICSIFTAIFVTKSIFMLFTIGKPLKKLSI